MAKAPKERKVKDNPNIAKSVGVAKPMGSPFPIPMPDMVKSDSVSDYYEGAALGSEQMLHWAVANFNEDPRELRAALRSVESYVTVRRKIGEMLEKSAGGKSSFDPWGESPVNKQYANAMAKDKLTAVKTETETRRGRA